VGVVTVVGWLVGRDGSPILLFLAPLVPGKLKDICTSHVFNTHEYHVTLLHEAPLLSKANSFPCEM
jgi:hypothetical protein